MNVIHEWKSFGGRQLVVRHDARSTGCPMEVSVYLPPQSQHGSVRMVIYLSGLTCNWQNVTTKGAFQRAAAELGLAIVCPDTSPRGANIPDENAYDLGQGAGFYVDATQSPWDRHYRMYGYVVDELPELVAARFPVSSERIGIFGHSMGGHGALVIALRNPARFHTVSAFAPIVAPSQVPWGEKALAAYLGTDRSTWDEYDACALVSRSQHPGTILIDQGDADEFYETQLRPDLFRDAAARVGQATRLRVAPGYDHSYYFIATFMDDHLRHHAGR
jgi:S-formylglutathione hydrolase